MERVLNPGTVLVTGGTGQVGAATAQLLREQFPEAVVVAPGRAELDLLSGASIRRFVRGVRPRWIVSSGAYTAVDAAETDRDAAWAANAVAPGVLAEEAKTLGAVVLHLSTDYVFPGTGERPWVETDATAPLNAYGASKLAGEQAIAAAGAAHVILRTSWVYAAAGKNFVRTMVRLLSTKDAPLRVVADQHGAPTSAAELASAIVSIMVHLENLAAGGSLEQAAAGVSGVYHCAGSGETTWAGLASAIRDYLVQEQGLTPPEIIPVPSTEYPTPARRPQNSRMDCGKLRTTFGVAMPSWEVSLRETLPRIAATDLAKPGFSG